MPKNLFSKEFNFKEKLYQRIKQKESEIKEKAALGSGKPYGREEVLQVLD